MAVPTPNPLFGVSLISLVPLAFSDFMPFLSYVRGSVVGWGTMLQAGRSRDRFSIRLLIFFSDWSNPFSRTLALGSTRPLTEMRTRNLPGGQRAAGA
jgi:hypothetical protein